MLHIGFPRIPLTFLKAGMIEVNLDSKLWSAQSLVTVGQWLRSERHCDA